MFRFPVPINAPSRLDFERLITYKNRTGHSNFPTSPYCQSPFLPPGASSFGGTQFPSTMPDKDESELLKYIHKLEARVEALEKAAEDKAHSLSSKWFKRSSGAGEAASAAKPSSGRELRMVLMGPPGAGTTPFFRPLRRVTYFLLPALLRD